MTAEASEGTSASAAGARRWLVRLVVALVALLPYLPAIDAPFVFDDLLIIGDNEFVQEGDTAAILSSGYWDGHDQLMGERQALYRPLTVLTYAWNWAVVGDDPAGFRWVNLLLHALCSVLVFELLLRLLRSHAGAVCGALLFAAHPIHTEAVTYVSGRADLLAALGFFGAWLVHELRGPAGGRRSLYVLSLALFALGLMAKEMAATLPAVLMLFDLVAQRRAGASLRVALRGLGRRARTYTGYFVVLLSFLALRASVLGALAPDASDIPMQANPLRDLSFVERLDDATGLLGRELGLLVWPARLSIDYSFDAIPVSAALIGGEALPWAALALVAFLAGLGGLLTRKALMASGALLFFFGTLFPVSNLAFVIGTNLGERVLYLTSFAVALSLGAALAWVRARGRGASLAAVGVALCLSLLASWRTTLRNRDYESGYRLFEAATEAYPRASRAQYNFGVYAQRRGALFARAGRGAEAQEELNKAVAAHERAVEVDPGYAEAHYALGLVAQERGDLAEAAQHFEAVLTGGSQVEHLPDAVTGFADCCLARGDAARGRAVLQQNVEGRATLRLAYQLSLGLLEAELGNDTAARGHYGAVLAGPEPTDEAHLRQRLRARVELARLFARTGDDARAEPLFRRAVDEAGELIGPHLVWIQFLRERGRLGELEQAIARAETVHAGHYALAAERAELARARGEWSEALRQHLAALAVQPGHAASRRGLAVLGGELLAKVRGARLPAARAQALLETAHGALRAALELRVRHAGLQFDYLGVVMALGRWEEAAKGFEAIVARDGPRAGEAALAAGECRLMREEYELARADFARAQELDGTSQAARLGLARVDLRRDPMRVVQELALVPAQETSAGAAVVRLLALEALGDDSLLAPALADFESRFGEDPEALGVRARQLSRSEATGGRAVEVAERALALAWPGSVEHARAKATWTTLRSR